MEALGIARPVSGHVFRVERKRGPAWYAKYRLPDGRQIQKRLGPAWTKRGRPEAGYFTKATAEAWLDATLAEARRGELAGMVQTGASFREAAAEWLRYCEHERAVKPGTLAGYRSIVGVLNEEFGGTAMRASRRSTSSAGRAASPRSASCPTEGFSATSSPSTRSSSGR